MGEDPRAPGRRRQGARVDGARRPPHLAGGVAAGLLADQRRLPVEAHRKLRLPASRRRFAVGPADGALSAPRRAVRWARLDSTQGKTDYEFASILALAYLLQAGVGSGRSLTGMILRLRS